MPRLALAHTGTTRVLPPKEEVLALVEETPNHFYWLGDFYDDGLDRSAVFPWRPPGEHKAMYMVPRLLWVWANDAVGVKNLKIENTCGLFTCVNPAHWRKRATIKAATLPPGLDVRLVRHQRVISHGDSKLPPVHIFAEDRDYAICGLKPNGRTLPPDTYVTCPQCLKSWRAAGRPFATTKEDIDDALALHESTRVSSTE